eukprot:638091-Pyramimonas_sp.AAC.1
MAHVKAVQAHSGPMSKACLTGTSKASHKPRNPWASSASRDCGSDTTQPSALRVVLAFQACGSFVNA